MTQYPVAFLSIDVNGRFWSLLVGGKDIPLLEYSEKQEAVYFLTVVNCEKLVVDKEAKCTKNG